MRTAIKYILNANPFWVYLKSHYCPKCGKKMRKKYLVSKSICMVLVLMTIMSLTSCTRQREKEYYADANNFITGEGVVDNIIYDENDKDIVLWLSEIDDAYQCSDFIIEGENFSIVLDNGILDKIKVGDTIEFTSAPRYFGNGDFMPLVALSVGDEELLNFEEGHKNLMDLY